MPKILATVVIAVAVCASPGRAGQGPGGSSEGVDLGRRLLALAGVHVALSAELQAAEAPSLLRVQHSLRFQHLMRSRNVDDILASYSTDGARISQEGTLVSGPNSLREWYSEAIGRFEVSDYTVRLDPSGIQVIEDFAAATGFVMARLSDQTGRIDDLDLFASFKVLLVQEGANWRILRQSLSQEGASWRMMNN